jgi:signal transduction histidine kinase
MNQRANQLLGLVGDQQLELKRTVKSLEQVNTLQRRTQQELVLARQRAEEAQRITEQFAANISHELRTPLNLILGFSEMMQPSPEVYGDMVWPPKLRQAVYQIYRICKFNGNCRLLGGKNAKKPGSFKNSPAKLYKSESG